VDFAFSPEEYGGQGAGHVREMIFSEESAYHGAPTGGAAVGFISPAIIVHGTEEQKRRFLPPIARAEAVWEEMAGRMSMLYLSSVSATIAAGTSEIQRNVIATRGLGLPRD
jgi:alkylation response protein AidB-like acyl-CoA dehydrogenase